MSQPPPGPAALSYISPICSGAVPGARWAHAAAVVENSIYVHGGIGQSCVLDDLVVLDTTLMVWRTLCPSAARPKDRPDKLHAAAMCALGATLWLFGGQQGRKHLRTLYSLNTETLAWRLAAPAGAAPAGREGATLTAVPAAGVAYLLGGQGKKLYNDLFVLRPGGAGGAEWAELKPAGAPPSPRSGHSCVWDGGDRLVCFGGATAGSTDSGLFVYSISANAWSAPPARGTAPSPRTRHSAVLLGSGTMLLFGGCSAAGVFFNDAYLLDLASMTWSRAQPLNPPPAPRYHHSCHVAGGKVVLYGGINPKQAFDAVVLLETSTAGSELSAVADELARMTGAAPPQRPALAGAGAGASSGAAAGLQPAAGGPPLIGDLMQLQLRDLLVKRNMEELTITAQQKADAIEQQLGQVQREKLALAKEVMQLKLISAEAEASTKQLREELAEASRALAREQAKHSATSAVLGDLRDSLDSREQQLAQARQLLDNMSAELGILASRLHRLQQERDALRATRRAERQAQREQLRFLPLSPSQPGQQPQPLSRCQAELEQPLQGAAAAAAQLQAQPQRAVHRGNSGIASSGGLLFSSAEASAADEPGSSDSQLFVDAADPSPDAAQQQQQQQQVVPLVSAADLQRVSLLLPGAASSSSGGSAGAAAAQQPSAGSADAHTPGAHLGDLLLAAGGGELARDSLTASTDEPVALCPHAQLEAACLLCMCQRFLAATDGCAVLPAQQQQQPGSAGAALPAPSSSGDAPAGSAAGPSSTGALATAACGGDAVAAAQYRQFLSISELARNRLEADNARLHARAQQLGAQVAAQQQQLRVLQAQPAALSACSIEELTALEAALEASTKAVRAAVMQQRCAEYQRQASAESLRCAVCMEAKRSIAFVPCGHQVCDACGAKIRDVCPFCRQALDTRIRLYE